MGKRSILHVAVAALALVASTGCAGGHDAAEKELDELRTTVTKMKAEQATLHDRLDALEAKRGPGLASAATGGAERPDLEVVRVEPDPGDFADADGPRPVIRAQGRGGSIVDGGKDTPQGPERDFEAAMDVFKKKQTEKAIVAFSSFLTRYPENPRAEEATFHRAEAYAGKGDPRRAIAEFEAVVARWPSGQRAPDALLLEAQSYQRLGDKNASDEAKKRLAASYPASQAAQKLGQKPK